MAKRERGSAAERRMMGWDMRMGLNAARGEYLGVIDGDGQFPVEAVIACLLKAEMEGLDLTKTYRFRRDDGIYRRMISYTYNGPFKLFFGLQIDDVNSKPKIIRREKYELLNLESDDWFADAEIMIRAKQESQSVRFQFISRLTKRAVLLSNREQSLSSPPISSATGSAIASPV